MDYDIIDYNKYYKRESNGLYSLHFINEKGLSLNEIRKIFSHYGQVLDINGTSNLYGLKFVKFEKLIEVIACCKGLQNNNQIQLLPEKSKIDNKFDLNKEMDKKSLNQFQKTEDSYPKSSDTYNTKTCNRNNGFKNSSESLSESLTHNYESKINGCYTPDPLIFNAKFPLFSRQQTSTDNNSSSIMNYDKYYKMGTDGNYTIHFANKKKLSLEEIKTIFSLYGNVLSIYCNRDCNKNLIFVKYKTLHDIICCLKGLQKSNTISILPQKNKVNNVTRIADQNSNQSQTTKKEYLFQKTSHVDKRIDSNSTHDEKFLENGKTGIRNMKIYGCDNRSDNTNNFLDTGSRISSHDSKSNVSRHDKQNRLISNRKHSDYDQVEKQYKTKSCSSIKPDADMKKNVSDDNEILALISSMKIKQNEIDIESEYFSPIQVNNSSSKVKVILMHEVIVANIHANYGVYYILHLFEKHNPISATMVKTASLTNIRYCHIYFKTIQDAIAIEEEFDNFVLSGKNLIVLRASELTGNYM